jgi:O-antigen/teichoic acid export membrane protein
VNSRIFGFASANLIPALVSLASVCVFTRILSPSELGAYNLAFSVVTVIQASAVAALGIGINRFYPAAASGGSVPSLLKTWYGALAVVCVLVVLVGPPLVMLLPMDQALRVPVALALLLFVLRSVVTLNQSVNRAADLAWRFAAIECVHTLLGFVLGLALIVIFKAPTAVSVLGGMIISAAICAMIDVKRLGMVLQDGSVNRNAVRVLVRFAGPLGIALATGCLLQYGDRFLISALAGNDDLGIYAVAYSLIERPTTLIGSSLSVAIFPIAAQALERGGVKSAKLQTERNGLAQLSLLLPACTGLFLCSTPISGLLVGPAFRDGVAALMPVMAVTALLRVLTAHYLEHAFYLAHRSDLQLRIYALGGAASVALNFLLVPPFGAVGAAWSALACQTVTAAVCWVVSRRIFPMGLPWREVARVAVATAAMAAALVMSPVHVSWPSLLGQIGLGAAVYITTMAALYADKLSALVHMMRAPRHLAMECLGRNAEDPA